MSAKSKMTLSISTWFCLPEQGMKDMEILCRATAFAVKSKCGNFPHKMHFITTSHNIVPWKFCKLYPDEWLQQINEKHTFYTVERRHPDGSFMTQSELLPATFHHSTRDLAVLHLDGDHDDLWDDLDIEPHVLSSRELVSGDNVIFDGFSIVDDVGSHTSEYSLESAENDSNNIGNEDVRRPVPTLIPGSFVSQMMFRHYAKTNHELNHGMCGGPLTCKPKKSVPSKSGRGVSIDSITADTSEVCGVFESVVPNDFENESLRGLAAFIDSGTVAKFLDDIEAGLEHTVSKGHSFLQGGEAADHVGSDQDPKKMDMNEIVNGDDPSWREMK